MSVEAEGLERRIERLVKAAPAAFLQAAVSKRSRLHMLIANILTVTETRVVNDPTAPAAWTDGKRIYINAARVAESAAPAELVAILLAHEALHVAHGHVHRMQLASDQELYNAVADVYVNTIIERRLGLPVSKHRGVTIDTFVEWFEKRVGRRLEELRSLAEAVGGGTVTVEQAYNIIQSLIEKYGVPREEVLRAAGGLGGGDLAPTGAQSGGEGRSEANRPATGPSGQHGGGEGGGGGGGGHGLEDLLEKYRIVQSALEEVARNVKRLAATGIAAGMEHGRLTRDVEVLERFLVPVVEAVLEAVSGEGVDYERTYAEYDDDVYWLPGVEEKGGVVYALLDVSESVYGTVRLLYSALVHVAKRSSVRVEVATFSVDLVDRFTIDPSRLPRRARLAGFGGTVWGRGVAEFIREAAKARVIIVASDFEIIYSREAMEALVEFKRQGGRVYCFTVGDEAPSYCDSLTLLPTLPS